MNTASQKIDMQLDCGQMYHTQVRRPVRYLTLHTHPLKDNSVQKCKKTINT